MKKIFTLLLIALFVPALSGAVEWNSCDEADHNCSGDCGAFIDTDNDGICDYSQPAPEDRLPPVEPVTIESDDTHDIITGKDLKTKTVQEIAELYGISAEKYAEELSKLIPVEVRITDSFQVLHDNFEMEPNVAKGIAASIK
ncbi:MAG: hypothetical protein KAS04_01920, partial [Candidatus Aenigmarchaeota archaeon]|nr:hypothetical protein [Candidatus Aenigmarchaeota archaeon]